MNGRNPHRLQLNPSAALIWELVDGDRSAADIAELLQSRVEGNWRQIRSDVHELAARLVLAGVLHYSSGHPSGRVCIRFGNRLGNRLFSYCAGRILAGGLNYELYSEGVPGFVNTSSGNLRRSASMDEGAPSHVVETCEDIEALLQEPDPPENVVVDGLFQDYPFLKPHRDYIRSRWLAFEDAHPVPPGPDDVVVHLRGGDVWSWNREPGQGAHRVLPLSFYLTALESRSFERLFIVCQDLDDPVAQLLRERYGGLVISGGEVEDFRFLASARRMVLSASTYAWWAGWLSDADEIHFPVCDYFGQDNGNWYREREKINLIIEDDPRYILHPVGPDSRDDGGNQLQRVFGPAYADLLDVRTFDRVDALVVQATRQTRSPDRCITSLGRQIPGLRTVFRVGETELSDGSKSPCPMIDTSTMPYSLEDVSAAFSEVGRECDDVADYHFRQLGKFYVPLASKQQRYWLVAETGVELLNCVRLFKDGTPMLLAEEGCDVGHQQFIARMLPGLVVQRPGARAARGLMLIDKEWLETLVASVEDFHGKPFWRVYLESIDPCLDAFQAASLEELYLQFVTREAVPAARHKLLKVEASRQAAERSDRRAVKDGFHYVIERTSTPLFYTSALRIESVPMVLINRRVDRQRLQRFLESARSQGLDRNVKVLEAIDGGNLSDEDVRENTTWKGYSTYCRHARKVRQGSLTRNSMACALSWRQVITDIEVPTLVLEDDAVLCDAFIDRASRCCAKIPLNWDLVYLAWNGDMWPAGEHVNCHVRRMKHRMHGMGALLVNPRCKARLLSVFPLDLQLDHDIPDKLIVPGLVNAYLLTDGGERLVYNDNVGGSTTQKV